MPEGVASGFTTFFGQYGIMIVLLIAMFALMILPQRKRDKKVKDMLSNLKVGDKIRTIGGFYGRIVQVKEDLIIMECGPDKVKLAISKGAVSTVENSEVENQSLDESKK